MSVITQIPCSKPNHRVIYQTVIYTEGYLYIYIYIYQKLAALLGCGLTLALGGTISDINC
jgi:hypothetical protein